MNSDEQQVRALLDAWGEASSQSDLIAQMNMMTDDVVFLSSGSSSMRRLEFAEAFRALMETVTLDVRSNPQEITVAGDIAVCWNLLEVGITPIEGGTTMKRAGNVLTILRREDDGRWRIWRDANMLAVV